MQTPFRLHINQNANAIESIFAFYVILQIRNYVMQPQPDCQSQSLSFNCVSVSVSLTHRILTPTIWREN